MAELLGLEIKQPPTKEELLEAANTSREAEGVIAFGNRSQRFIQRECVQCGGVFAVNRSNIACCSDTCRQHHLLHKFGLEWDPSARSLEDRWSVQTGGPEPLVVPPSILPLIEQGMTEQTPVLPEQSIDSLLDLSKYADL